MRNKLFILVLILNLILGLGIFLGHQESESQSEKRSLATNENIKLDSNLSRNIESVLKDQFYFRDRIVRYYYKGRILLNIYTEKTIMLPKRVFQKIFNNNNQNGELAGSSFTYLAEGVIDIGNGYLINSVVEYNDDQKYLASSRGYNVNEFALNHPDIKTYVYFPTRIEELLNSDYPNEALCQELFVQQLNGSIKYDVLDINDFSDHEKYYYRSDYHWNAYGAYQGYSDVIEMINDDYDIGEPKEILNINEYPYEFYGNIANKLNGYGLKDKIVDLDLEDIGQFDYYVNGEVFDYFAVKEDYKQNGNTSAYSDYDLYFGDNFFLREFDFHNDDKPNLLIFGDSFNNTNMMWIASHFNKTIVIDLRAKSDDFNLNNFINENDIDIALVSYYYYNGYFNGNLYIPID